MLFLFCSVVIKRWPATRKSQKVFWYNYSAQQQRILIIFNFILKPRLLISFNFNSKTEINKLNQNKNRNQNGIKNEKRKCYFYCQVWAAWLNVKGISKATCAAGARRGERDETSRFRPFGKCLKHTRAGLYNIRIDVWREKRGRRIRIRIRRRSWAEWKCRIKNFVNITRLRVFSTLKGLYYISKKPIQPGVGAAVCAVGDVCGIGGIRCLVPTISQSALNKRQNSIGTRHFDVPLLLNCYSCSPFILILLIPPGGRSAFSISFPLIFRNKKSIGENQPTAYIKG